MNRKIDYKKLALNIVVYIIIIVGYLFLYSPYNKDNKSESSSKTEFIYQQF